MIFSYNWLHDFFEESLPAPDEVAQLLGAHSFEIEGVNLTDTDTLIDVDILPNRSSDCLSYVGMARELSALTGLSCKQSKEPVDQIEFDNIQNTSDYLQIIPAPVDVVPRMTKRIATNIVVKASPDWLRARLESIGQKSINNVVDITNYVMWVTGQPVHAFDHDALAGDGNNKQMTIRYARDDEEMTDLTGTKHTLDSTMLVVADAKKALDIAGIKGGIGTGVSESTKTIVLSACNYDFKSIRHTSKKLRLNTDAQKRYENQVPLYKADQAHALLAYLITTECQGTVLRDMYDTNPNPIEQWSVVVDHGRIESILGVSLDKAEVVKLLESLDLGVQYTDDLFNVTVDSSRPDLRIPQDIIEEVGRMYGYVNIKPQPITEGFNLPTLNAVVSARNKVSDTLTTLGFSQINSRSLVSGGVVKLTNSLNANADSLRVSLQSLLKEKVERNFVHTEYPHFFEIGKVFSGIEDGVVQEHWSFAGILGRRKIKDKQKNDLFLQTKGVLESVFAALHVTGVEWKEGAGTGDDAPVAVLEINGDVLGSVGVNWWELNFEELITAIDTTVEYQPPSKYPKIDRDIAVWVPQTTRVRDVRDLIESAGVEKCIETSLFDVYEDVENSRKSIGFRLIFQCHDTTLSDNFANSQMQKIYDILTKQKGFELR